MVVGGAFLYKRSTRCVVPIAAIYCDESAENKREVDTFIKIIKNYGITFKTVHSSTQSQDTKAYVFFDQKMFDEFDKKNESLLKILVRLRETYEIQEISNIVGFFCKDKYSQTLDFVQRIMPSVSNVLVLSDIRDKNYNKSFIENITVYAREKGINILHLEVDDKKNLSSVLKEIPGKVQAVLAIPSEYILKESEVILHHFKNKKIPVFANSALFVRLGALAGFDYDNEELFHDIANIIMNFDKDNSKTVGEDTLANLTYQLHVNMDTLRTLNIDLDEGILDEAVTVGSADS